MTLKIIIGIIIIIAIGFWLYFDPEADDVSIHIIMIMIPTLVLIGAIIFVVKFWINYI